VETPILGISMREDRKAIITREMSDNGLNVDVDGENQLNRSLHLALMPNRIHEHRFACAVQTGISLRPLLCWSAARLSHALR
jgi:hypothetical protein